MSFLKKRNSNFGIYLFVWFAINFKYFLNIISVEKCHVFILKTNDIIFNQSPHYHEKTFSSFHSNIFFCFDRDGNWKLERKNKRIKSMKLNTSLFPLFTFYLQKASKEFFSKMETPEPTIFISSSSVFSVNYRQFNDFRWKVREKSRVTLFAILN